MSMSTGTAWELRNSEKLLWVIPSVKPTLLRSSRLFRYYEHHDRIQQITEQHAAVLKSALSTPTTTTTAKIADCSSSIERRQQDHRKIDI